MTLPGTVLAIDSPPFNIRYSIPPVEAALAPSDRQAIAMAAALDSIDRLLAERLRRCKRGSRCRARKFCALCGSIQAEQFGKKFAAKLLKLSNPAHLTLTTRSCFHLTRKDVTAPVKAFNRLKDRERFKKCVRGGVANFQIGYGASGWLPHIHAVLDQQGKLSKSWIKKIWTSLGGGWSVCLQRITPGTQFRVLVYGARKPDLPLDPGLLRQFHSATAGFISIRAWGTLHPLHGRKPGRGTQKKAEALQ